MIALPLYYGGNTDIKMEARLISSKGISEVQYFYNLVSLAGSVNSLSIFACFYITINVAIVYTKERHLLQFASVACSHE